MRRCLLIPLSTSLVLSCLALSLAYGAYDFGTITFKRPYIEIGTSTSIQPRQYYFIDCNFSLNGTVTLPVSDGNTGHEFLITKADPNGTVTLGIVPQAGDTINGTSAPILINTQYESAYIYSIGGTQWRER